MRRPLTAALLLVSLGAASAAFGQDAAPLPSAPKLPSFGKGLFAPRSTERGTPQKGAESAPLPDRPTLLRSPASTFAGREATLQALQDCYAREAPKVRGAASAETRVRRLRLACDNEEIADTRAWLKWSKIGDGKQSRKIVNALQQDDAEKALASVNGAAP